MRPATALRLGVGAAGVAMMGFGAWTFWLEKSRIGQPASIGRWLVGGVIGHDAILAPAVFLACALVGRLTGPRVRRALALFLLAGGSLAIVGLPDILRSGDNPNPTVTPLDYPRNLTIALGAVAVIAVLSAVPGGMRDRRARVRAAPEPDSPEPDLALEPEPELEPESEPDTMPESVPEPEPEPEPEASPTPPTPPEQASTEQDGDPEDG